LYKTQANVTQLLYSQQLDLVVSYDSNGRTGTYFLSNVTTLLVIWKNHKGSFPTGKIHTKTVIAAALSKNQKIAYSASSDGLFKQLNLETGAFE